MGAKHTAKIRQRRQSHAIQSSLGHLSIASSRMPVRTFRKRTAAWQGEPRLRDQGFFLSLGFQSDQLYLPFPHS